VQLWMDLEISRFRAAFLLGAETVKKVLIVLAVLMFGGISFGQVAGRFDAPAQTVVNFAGRTFLAPSAGASVTICSYPATGGLPCTNKASVCPDSTAVGCTTGAPNNPITADTEGNFGFWALAGTYSYSVCPVSGVCDGPYIATIAVDVNGTVANAAHATLADTATSALKDATQDKGFINVVNDCGATGAGFPTDDGAVIAACIVNNPGKVIFFPKMRSTPCSSGSGGGCAGSNDFYSTVNWFVNDNGTFLVGGGGPGRWSGPVQILFADNIAGITFGTACYACGMRNLYLMGPRSWTRTTLSTWADWSAESQFQGNSGFDGIQLLGGSWVLENVTVDGFRRHGVLVNGNSGGQPDLGIARGLAVLNNGAYGVYTYGSDANVLHFEALDAIQNMLGAVNDSAQYGNTFSPSHSALNGGNPSVAAGANKAITAATGLTVLTNVLTIATDVPNTWTAGQWVTTTGSTDGTFNGTCKLLTVATSSATCNFTHANGSTGGGTAATSSSTQILAYYTLKSIKYGGYVSTSTAGCSNFTTAYTESNSGPSDFGCALVIGPQGIDGGGSSGFQTGHRIIPSSNGSLYFNTQFITLVPRTNAGVIQIKDATGVTTEWVADATGATAQLGAAKIGTTAAPTTGDVIIGLPNNKRIASRNAANNANITVALVFSDDSLNLGSGATGGIWLQTNTTTQGNHSVTGTLGVTGLTTATGGIKAGASGSTISDSRELVQNAHSCGTTTTCANTANGSNRIVFGTVPLTSGTPSTATVTGMTAFTSTSSYVCTVTNATNAANNLLKVANASTTSFVITGPNTLTDTINYICIGN
jgi:hypothetical protein